MALTKITKHIIHGATIVQVRYKDFADGSWGVGGTENSWGSITITPQYADSTTDIMFSGVLSTEFHETSSPMGTIFMDIDGTNEYTISHVTRQGNMSFSYEQYGNRNGSSVVASHRVRFGDTNNHTITMQVNTDGGSGTLRAYDGFILVKEIANGVLSANSTNTYITNR